MNERKKTELSILCVADIGWIRTQQAKNKLKCMSNSHKMSYTVLNMS